MPEHEYNVGMTGNLFTACILEKLQHTSAVSGVQNATNTPSHLLFYLSSIFQVLKVS